jgi:CRISPR system Cascade subunit CasE
LDAKHCQTGETIKCADFRLEVVPEGRDRNGKPGHAGVFLAIWFEGLLEVTDPQRFAATLACGVGSGKAFGFGLLSVAAHKE